MKHCAYCFGEHTTTYGEIFCSADMRNMTTLQNGILQFQHHTLQSPEHVTRTSLRLNLDGKQVYKLGRRQFVIAPSSVLLLPNGTPYNTFFDGQGRQLRMVSVEFGERYLNSVYTTLSCKHEYLLENPDQFLHFNPVETVAPVSQNILNQIQCILQNSEASSLQGFDALAEELVRTHGKVRIEMQQLRYIRESTRIEIYQRLQRAKNFIEENYEMNLTLEDMAGAACLSVHHFKRLFKQLFHIPPHQYLVEWRLRSAKKLLQHSDLSVNDICYTIGFQNTSSFIRLFKTHTGITPVFFKKSAMNLSS